MRALSAEEAEITERYLTKLTCGVQYWYRGESVVPIASLTQEEIDGAMAELSRMRDFLKDHAEKSLFLVTRKEAELEHPSRIRDASKDGSQGRRRPPCMKSKRP